ncbi:FixH family protein [Sphingobacterium sp. lm-10]|uniref:FixH family protein n=1 Tax=Sphingobacterium sp. lm-10 TaxID=2944904 RepID=UPI002021622C|nr:FixH family protein [Sphingobacterium sp. lm-10]MCL7986325.1 FixH family protein [Sphingobacterium sp. lm-10]
MNWGGSIIAGMGAFMAFIIGSVFYMVGQDTDTLEEDNYYDKGIHYSEVYTRKENLQRDQAMPTLRLKGDSLCIYFTTSGNKGMSQWKRPSNARLDTEQHFQTAADSVVLPLASYERGNWQIELTWEGEGTAYQSIHHLFIP